MGATEQNNVENPEAVAWTSLTTWLGQRPKWIQQAAVMLLNADGVSDEDVSRLAEACVREARGEVLKVPVLPKLGASDVAGGHSLLIAKLDNVVGVNALAPRKPLGFGAGSLAIVYGANGSGKSGYVRMLKHACGSRSRGQLLANVYAGGQEAQSTSVEYQIDGEHFVEVWRKDDGPLDNLLGVDIFDTTAGRVYLDDDNELTYEPATLAFISDLIALQERIGACIDRKIRALPSEAPLLPIDLSEVLPVFAWGRG